MDKAKRTFLRNRRKASKASTGVPYFREAMSSSDGEFVQEPESSASRDVLQPSTAASHVTASQAFLGTAQSGRTIATDADFPDDFPAVEDGYGYAKGSRSGFEDDFTGFGSDEGEVGSSDDDEMRRTKNFNDDDDDEDEDENRTLPLKRQATTEAVRRRPLDEGSNSSDEGEDESSGSDAATPAASIVSAPPDGPVLSQEDAKKVEQERLLKRWGFDEDSDDDDDEPVVMGSKYLAKRRTESS